MKTTILSDQVTELDITIVLTELQKTFDRNVEGDVVELGCYSGTMAINLQKYLISSDKKLWLYDSFSGLPPKSVHDQTPIGDNFQAGELAVSKNTVINNFKRHKLPVPIIKKAWFSDLLEQDLPEKICLAFLDGDFYDSILVSLQLVHPKMSDGGCILVHDFDRSTLPGVRRALQDFFKSDNFVVQNNIAIIRY